MDIEVVSHYHVLGISHDASDVIIKLSYYRLSREWHPDKHPHASTRRLIELNAMMQKLNDAQACLRDPEARKTYNLRCASIVFTHENDPGNFFRREYEAQRKAAAEAAQRRRNEERERNAARQREREEQERRRREAEERARRAAEERERQEQERERQRAEREREEERREERRRQQRREEADQARRQQNSRTQNEERDEDQPRQSTPQPQAAQNPNFTRQDWENFCKLVCFFIMLHEMASENQRPGPNGTSTSPNESTSHDRFAYSDHTTDPPRSYQRQTSSEGAPRAAPSADSNSQRARSFDFTPLPAHSSKKRWSEAEVQGLLKIRQDNPSATWDSIATRLNARFGMQRNGNAVRQKYNRSI